MCIVAVVIVIEAHKLNAIWSSAFRWKRQRRCECNKTKREKNRRKREREALAFTFTQSQIKTEMHKSRFRLRSSLSHRFLNSIEEFLRHKTENRKEIEKRRRKKKCKDKKNTILTMFWRQTKKIKIKLKSNRNWMAKNTKKIEKSEMEKVVNRDIRVVDSSFFFVLQRTKWTKRRCHR